MKSRGWREVGRFWIFSLPPFLSNLIGFLVVGFIYFMFKSQPDRAMILIGIYVVWKWLRKRRSVDAIIAKEVRNIAQSVDRLARVVYSVERVAEAVNAQHGAGEEDVNAVPRADVMEYDHLSPEFF